MSWSTSSQALQCYPSKKSGCESSNLPPVVEMGSCLRVDVGVLFATVEKLCLGTKYTTVRALPRLVCLEDVLGGYLEHNYSNFSDVKS